MADQDSTVADLLELGRGIWGEDFRMDLSEVLAAVMVVVGDIARLVRDGGDPADLERELGNLIFSAIRWADDLGLDLSECLDAAVRAQRAFVEGVRP